MSALGSFNGCPSLEVLGSAEDFYPESVSSYKIRSVVVVLFMAER